MEKLFESVLIQSLRDNSLFYDFGVGTRIIVILSFVLGYGMECFDSGLLRVKKAMFNFFFGKYRQQS